MNVFFTSTVFSQYLPCKTPEMNEWAKKNNPLAIQSEYELEEFTKSYISRASKDENILIIPVVFHVVHNYGSENISKEQILDALRILNEDFRKMNADTVDIIPEFKSIAADTKIEFRLAKIDPNGNCTDGIDRVVSPLTYNADENIKFVATSWDRTKYLNIWTVASIASGAAGYSYYPSMVNGSWGEAYDGVVILSTYVGSIGTGNYQTARALTHEVGHYLNLMHPWGNSNTPGLAENCNDDDQVSDTPNTIGHTSCNLYSVTCGSLDNVQNYMEYAYCDRMFTNGQKLRMRAALNSPISGRNNLWTEQNLIATGVSNLVTPTPCLPIVDFIATNNYNCINNQVYFQNLTWNTDTITIVEWNFPGATPSYSNNYNPIVTYPNAGIYDVTLTVHNPAGTSTLAKNQYVQILDPNDATPLPWFESFESNDFPYININSKAWLTSGNADNHWQKTSVTSFTGNYSLIAPNHLNYYNQKTAIMTENILIGGQNAANKISFKVAYAQQNDTSDDKLEVYVSLNCGQTWSLRYAKQGNYLQTANNYYTNFIPNSSEWRTEYINIGLLLNHPFIRLKFVATTGKYSNPIYIDDIMLEKSTDAILTFNDKYTPFVFPNPVNQETSLYLYSPTNNVLNVLLTNSLGQTMYSSNYLINAGDNEIDLSSFTHFDSGIYFLKLTINNECTNIKLIIP